MVLLYCVSIFMVTKYHRALKRVEKSESYKTVVEVAVYLQFELCSCSE